MPVILVVIIAAVLLVCLGACGILLAVASLWALYKDVANSAEEFLMYLFVGLMSCFFFLLATAAYCALHEAWSKL